mgnify:CR=1 FL=1
MRSSGDAEFSDEGERGPILKESGIMLYVDNELKGYFN